MTYFREISWVGRGTPKLHLQQIGSSGPSLRKDAVHLLFPSVKSSPSQRVVVVRPQEHRRLQLLHSYGGS